MVKVYTARYTYGDFDIDGLECCNHELVKKSDFDKLATAAKAITRWIGLEATREHNPEHCVVKLAEVLAEMGIEG